MIGASTPVFLPLYSFLVPTPPQAFTSKSCAFRLGLSSCQHRALTGMEIPLCTHHMINAWRSSTPSCETLTSSPFAVTAVFSPSDTLIAGGPAL